VPDPGRKEENRDIQRRQMMAIAGLISDTAAPSMLTKEDLKILTIRISLTCLVEIRLTVAVFPTDKPVIAFENPLMRAMNPSPLLSLATPILSALI
jgi:hypothetical protein